MSKRNILVLAPEGSVYDNPFKRHGNVIHKHQKLADCDLVVFTGGTDVNPALYEQPRHQYTSIPDIERDKREQAVFNYAVLLGIPMTGICRGAQFLCVMNGGTLIQHVEGHAIHGMHPMYTKDEQVINVTSTHHQMMNPAPGYPEVHGSGEVLGWANNLSDVHEIMLQNGHSKNLEFFTQEPEVVWWGKTRSLAVQYHPEYMDSDSDGWNYYQHLLEEYVL